jgi:CHAT domain-containing protein
MFLKRFTIIVSVVFLITVLSHLNLFGAAWGTVPLSVYQPEFSQRVTQMLNRYPIELVGSGDPNFELLKTNPAWGTQSLQKLFQGASWKFLSNGQFHFIPPATASARSDLFPMHGTYSVLDNTLKLEGESWADSGSHASIDGWINFEGAIAYANVIYTASALDSHRIVKLTQMLNLSSPLSGSQPFEEGQGVEESEATDQELIFNSTWETADFGLIVLQQNQHEVQGTYTGYGGGQITGVAKGHRLDFTWQDPIRGRGQGFFRSVPNGRILAGMWTNDTDADNIVSSLATRSSDLEDFNVAIMPLDRQQIRDLGYDLVLQGNCEKAVPLLRRSLELFSAERTDDPTRNVFQDTYLIDEANILIRLVHCQYALENYEEFLGYLNNAIELRDLIAERDYLRAESVAGLPVLADNLENWRRRLVDDSEKITALEQGQPFFENLVQVLVKLGSYEEALVASEKSRARAFADLLTARLSSQASGVSEIPSVEKIRRIAAEQNATLVEYSLASDKTIYIWVIKPTGEIEFRVSDLQPSDSSLSEMVQVARDSLGVRGRGLFRVVPTRERQEQPLRRLYELLVLKIDDLLPKDPNASIIFVPQGSLFLVPFPALQDSEKRYLIEKHTILTIPSIQVLENTRKLKTEIQQRLLKDALIVGNPIMPLVAMGGKPPQQLSNLPGSEEEAQSIARLLNTRPLLGKDATKTVVIGRMATARIIHLATHGLLEYEATRSSVRSIPGAIALAPDSTAASELISQEPGDGLLTSTEILDLRLNADLVVLSACDTARGEITGDGVVGLSRSFISAGTPSIIVSLWEIPDAPTTELMIEFYRQWLQTGNKAQALRQAMLATKAKYPNAPQTWAAFTLIGEGT